MTSTPEATPAVTPAPAAETPQATPAATPILGDNPAAVKEAAPAATPILGTDPAPAAEAVPVTPADGTPATRLIDSLNTDLKSERSLQDFQDVNALAKSHVELQKKFGKRLDELTGDELRQVYTNLGAPASAEDYHITLPEGVNDDGSFDKFKEIALEQGLSTKQAESVFSYAMTESIDALQLSQQQVDLQNQDWIDEIKQEFGAAYDQRVELANDALRTYGGADVVDVLEKAGLSSNPAIVKMFSEIGKANHEDTAVGEKKSAQFGTAPKEAAERIAELWADKEFIRRYRDKMDPGHTSAVKQLTELYRLKSVGKK